MIELMVVMSIFAILVTLTVPAYNNFRKSQSCAAAANEFAVKLRQAHQLAMLKEVEYGVSRNIAESGTKWKIWDTASGEYLCRYMEVPGRYNGTTFDFVGG
jgi:Tfp pilus assembly protein FimT